MASKEAAIKAALTGNAPWVALVTGGTFLFDELGTLGLTPESAEAAGCYDADGKLELTAVLTFDTNTEAEILTSERQFFRIWYFHHDSYSLIRQARRKAKDLLDRQQVTADNEGRPLMRWVDDIREFTEDDLGGALAAASRYFVQLRRR